MSDQTAGSGHEARVHHPVRTPRAEFYTYFALIFLAAIPFAAVAWLWALLRDRQFPVHGPLARAWREAGALTPTIFRP